MAENTDGGLLFGIRLDNSQLAKDVELSQKLFDSISKKAETVNDLVANALANANKNAANTKIDINTNPARQSVVSLTNAVSAMPQQAAMATSEVQQMFEQLNGNLSNMGATAKSLVAGYFSIEGIKGLMSQVFAVRSQFAALEVSFDTLLGDHAKAQKLFNDIKTYGATTPMNLGGLATATQTMLGFGIEAEKVMGYLRALGDISMGDEARFQSLALSFSQASATGKLMGGDLLQMINAGFNPLEQMAKTTGKSIAKLKEEMSEGKISAEMLQKAFMDAAGEGGKYNGMLMAQSKTLSGAYSNLEDNIDAIYNEIGEMTEGIMIDAINGVGDLAQNWKEVALVVAEVATVYGTWKAASMAETAIEQVISEKEANEKLVEVFKQHQDEVYKLMDADDAYAMKMSGLEEGTAEYMQKLKDMVEEQKAAAEEELKNVNLLTSAEEAKFAKQDEAAQATRKQLAATAATGNAKAAEALQTKLLTQEEAKNATARNIQQLNAQKQIAAEKAVTAAKKADTLATLENTTAVKAASTASTLWQKGMTALGNAAKKLGATLKETIMSNPYALAIAGAIALAEAIYNVVTAENAREKATKTITAAQADAFKYATEEERKKGVQKDFKDLEKLTEGTKDYKAAVEALMEKYPELNKAMGEEFSKADLLVKGQKAVKDAIMERATATAYAAKIEENQGSVDEASKKVVEDFKKALEDMDYKGDMNEITMRFQKALRNGISIEGMDEDIKAVFKEQEDGIMDTIYNALTAGGYDAARAYSKSSAQSFWSWIKESFTGEELKEGNSALEGSVLKFEALRDAIEEANNTMEDFNNGVQDATNALNDLNEQPVSVLTDLKEKQKKLKEEMDKFTATQLKDNKMLKAKRDEYNKLGKEIENYNKKVYGDKDAAKKAQEKRLSDQSALASEYAKIQQERMKATQAIQKKAIDPAANKDILIWQIEDVNKKADDSLKLLKAKFYNIDDKMFSKLTESFDKALKMPIDEAKARLAQVTTEIAKVQNDTTGKSKSKLPALQAEQSGLQFVVNQSYEKMDYSAEEKYYEQFLSSIVDIANRKQEELADVSARAAKGKLLGGINEQEAEKATARIEAAYDAEVKVLMDKMGVSSDFLMNSILTLSNDAYDAMEAEIAANIAKLQGQIPDLEQALADGYDVSGELETARANLAAALDEMTVLQQQKLDELVLMAAETNEKIKKLEEEQAKGKNVSKELALQKALYSQLTSQISKTTEKMRENNTAIMESTTGLSKMELLMGKKAKWDKIHKYYSQAASDLQNIIDNCDTLSDTTKEVFSTLTSLGEGAFQVIDGIHAYAEGTIKAEEAAAEGASTAIATAEKASAILTIISAAIQAVMAIVKIFNKHGKTATAEKNIKAIEGQVQDLNDAYDELDDKISKAYGSHATTLIAEQDVLLQQKKLLLQQQIAEEQKKKSKKQDSEQIKQWKKEIEEIDKITANRDEDWIHALLGTDYNGVIEDFSGAIVNAMSDANTSVKDAVNDIAKNLKRSAATIKLNEILQGTEEDPGVAKKYAKALADAWADGFIDESEAEVLAGLEDSIATTSENYLSQLEGLWDEAEAQREALSGGVTNMTQDTAEEMNGRLTQIQSHTFSITESTRQLVDFSSQQLAVLQSISSYTADIKGQNERIISYLGEFELRGVKMK